jgi:hypothetical protein
VAVSAGKERSNISGMFRDLIQQGITYPCITCSESLDRLVKRNSVDLDYHVETTLGQLVPVLFGFPGPSLQFVAVTLKELDAFFFAGWLRHGEDYIAKVQRAQPGRYVVELGIRVRPMPG